MTYTTTTLSNGLRIIHLPTTSAVGYCGFAVNGGTRDEVCKGEEGIAHFVEHMLFKGTTKRRSWHIVNRMENVGGELNAYTAKEETLIYSVFLNEHLQRATELLCDLVRNSTYPLSELEKEREVVLDEINSYKDNPSELIYDEFENRLFANHALGKSILGTSESVEAFTPAHCQQFTQRLYTPSNMVFFVMSQTPLKKIASLVERYMGDIPAAPSPIERVTPSEFAHFNETVQLDTYQTHAIYGGKAYHMHHPNRTALFLLNNILGGPGMNSRLNLALRERTGYVYNVESSITSYTDTGVFAAYIGTDPKKWDNCRNVFNKTLLALCTKQLTTLQLESAKKQLMGQMGIGQESRENIALGLGKSYLHYNRYDTLQQVYERIEPITASQLLEVANEVIHPDHLSLLCFQ